ncbi:MAG: hypothetical protein O8C63_06695 [Candidatus Methanoperedens sp.]|nr:hypothetical protein [Candidatus Methanoperedens sp.]
MKLDPGKKGWVINILSLIGFVILWHVLVILARDNIFNIPFIRLRDVPTPIESWYAFVGSLVTRTYGPALTYGLLEHTRASLLWMLSNELSCLMQARHRVLLKPLSVSF